MKQMLSVMLALLLILLPMTLVCAQGNDQGQDSADVSDAHRSLLGVPEDATVIRMYNTPVMFVFSELDTIEAVLAGSKMQIIYYVEMPDGTVKELTLSEGEAYEMDESAFTPQAIEAFKDGHVLDLIGEEVTVQNVYYLTGESSRAGTAIYYRTDKGDYVYYNYWELGECFFTAETFGKLMDEIVEEKAKNGHLDGGMGMIGDWDLSAFRIDSPTFNLNAQLPGTETQPENHSVWIWAGIAVVIVAAAVASGVILWKKRKTA
ncbi:MAG: hypothetical protein E7448_08145 [Ruminococcaceae bacterium]|nr:hypothetical protein [Oscillospiraceae bacterium]